MMMVSQTRPASRTSLRSQIRYRNAIVLFAGVAVGAWSTHFWQLVLQVHSITGVSREASLLGSTESAFSVPWLVIENSTGKVMEKLPDVPFVSTGEYRDPGIQFGYRDLFQDDSKSLPLPVQVMEEYRAHHSVQSLASNPDLKNRKFAIAFFSCPYQAGHRLHDFLNVFLMAVMTNRTLLWKDWDEEACRHSDKYGRESKRKKLCAMNNVEHCRQTLLPAPWIPMFDEWSKKLKLRSPHKLQVFKNEEAADRESTRRKWRLAEKIGGIDVKPQRHQTVAFPELGIQFSLFGVKGFRDEMLHSEPARITATKLHSWGTNFLYGMLQRYGYDLAEHLRPSQLEMTGDDVPFSIGLHSRHAKVANNGCDISEELTCLQQILGNKTRPSQTTTLRVMSDRQCTIDRLQAEFHNPPTFTVMVADHNEGGLFSPEHGPYAGLGYFQDMALLSEVRSGFVGSARSSTHLPLEWVEFHRKLEIWRQSEGLDENPPQDIPYCYVSGNKFN